MNTGLVKRLSRLHRAVFRVSRGRLGRRYGNAEVLLLTTTGRKSGEKRTVPLAYLRNDPGVVVIASFGGSPTPPSWYLNLVADPEVEVETPRGRWRGLARTATPEERDLWWPRAVAVNPEYAEYQERTDRVIPVVLIDPVP